MAAALLRAEAGPPSGAREGAQLYPCSAPGVKKSPGIGPQGLALGRGRAQDFRAMRIPQYLSSGRLSFSFEYFPPKTAEGEKNLFETVRRLQDLSPSFVSVTYGAGGSTREQTIEIVTRIQKEAGLTAMAHLTCVGHSRAELAAILVRLEAAGIENVLALRGDPPKGETKFTPAPGGFHYAGELAAFIHKRFHFAIGGGCYPETHPEAESPEADVRHLKEKTDAGAQFLITQLFYDNQRYWDFLKRARAAGISVPILPGIMPIVDVAQIQRIAQLSKAHIPTELSTRMERVRGDAERSLTLGVEWAAEQCRRLLQGGAPGVHFYTLNKSAATRRILETLHAEGFGKK